MAFDPEDPDTKKALKAAIDEAVGDAVEEAKTGLENKNKALLAELKEAKKGKTIDPAEIERLEAANEKLQTSLDAALKAGKDATTAAEKATKALEQETGFTQKLLIVDGLKTALIANGVKDEDYLDMATAKFVSGTTIKVEGDQRIAMYGDKPLPDFIKEWAATDAGKKVVAAAVNGGGGAGGGKTGETGKTMTREQFEAADGPAKVAFAKDGGKVVDATT